MSATYKVPRRIAASVAALGAAFATLAFASPAFAADGDVKVSISGLGDDVSIGNDSESFNVRVENETDQPITAVRRRIVIQLPGLTADQVSITRSRLPLFKSSSNPGEVTFEGDPLGFRLREKGERDDSESTSFSLRFSPGAPSGEANVTVIAVSAGQLLGSDSDSITVRPGRGQNQATTPPPTTLPPVTMPPVTPEATQTQTQVAPLDASQDDIFPTSSGIPTFLYILGAILVVLGGGILWLMFRNPKPEPAYVPAHGYPNADYDQTRAPSLGYPVPPRPAHTSPTTVMPTVRDPYTPPPGVDPWAKGAGPDSTQQFPR
jgi:hypothetical protein